jgi:hypothetical protein
LYKFDSGGQIWAKPLSNKDFAVIFYNYNFFGSVEMVLNWSDLGFSATASLKVRDLWLHEVTVEFSKSRKPKLLIFRYSTGYWCVLSKLQSEGCWS